MKREWTSLCREHAAGIYAALVGVGLLGLGWLALLRDAAPVATPVMTLGGALLAVAPLISRVEGTLRIGPVELTLRRRVLEAIKTVDDATLEALHPLVTRPDISITKFNLPARFGGRRLVDEELQFLRQKLNVSILGVLRPDEKKWRAGGAISELDLPAGTQLLAAGHPETLGYLRFLAATDQDDLWQLAGAKVIADPDLGR